MTQIIYGDRIGKQGNIRLGCSAAIFDGQKRILLTKRTDNGQWCLPSGALEPGESVAEACEREVIEETGLSVNRVFDWVYRITYLIAVLVLCIWFFRA